MVPPHSMEAEQAVLGALLLDNEAWDSVGDLLTEADFYRGEHRLIYAAIGRLVVASRTADVVTVHDVLRGDGRADDVGGMRYLNDLCSSVASARTARTYAEIVRQRSVCRLLMAAGRELIQGAVDEAKPDGDVAGLIDRVTMGMLGLQAGAIKQQEPQLAAHLLAPWLDALQDRADGKINAVPLGLRGMDRLMGGGAQPGDLIVVGARPSMGKSALSNGFARYVAEHHGPVAALSMEDSAPMLISRQVASLGRVNLADIRNPMRAPGSMWSGITSAIETLGKIPLYLDDQACLALMDVRRKALQVKRRAGGLSLLIVDYLQLMEDEGENRAYELAAIARGLKRLAKELQVPVILLSQLSREADKVNGPPRLEHLKESGAIEEAADIVMLLWREGRRNPKPDNKHTAQVEFAKHKNGATDTVPLWFDGATQRFEDLSTGD